MQSPNINMRDPAIYRIRFAEHHMTGDAWKVYPMYSYAHPIEDALENITHSICTLEFEDQRPFYDWVLERIVPLLRRPQFEAAKRMLDEIHEAGIEGAASSPCTAAMSPRADKLGAIRYERRAEAMFAIWSRDPDLAAHDADEFFKLLREHTRALHAAAAGRARRAPAQSLPAAAPVRVQPAEPELRGDEQAQADPAGRGEASSTAGTTRACRPSSGLRRRGYTPQSLQLFAERTGVSKSPQWIDYALLEQALRDDLDARAPRAVAVLRPIKLVLDQLPRGPERGHAPARCTRSMPELGMRTIPLRRANCGSRPTTSWTTRRPTSTVSRSAPAARRASRCGCATAT